jgi:hypothetical protein
MQPAAENRYAVGIFSETAGLNITASKGGPAG